MAQPNRLQTNTLPAPIVTTNTIPTPTVTTNTIPLRSTPDTPVHIVPSKMNNELNSNQVYDAPNKAYIGDMTTLKQITEQNINKLKSHNVTQYKQLQKEEFKVNKILNDPLIDDSVKVEAEIKANNIKIDENDVLDNLRNLPTVNNEPALQAISKPLLAEPDEFALTEEELAANRKHSAGRVTYKQKQILVKERKNVAKQSIENVQIADESLTHSTNVTADANKLKQAKSEAYKNLETLAGADTINDFKNQRPNIMDQLKANQKLTSEQAKLLNKLLPNSKLSSKSTPETVRNALDNLNKVVPFAKDVKVQDKKFGANVTTLQSTQDQNIGSSSLKQSYV